jgi:pyruvate,water dikinase
MIVGPMRKLLKTFFHRGPRRQESTVEELRNAFRSRYHHFKLLLNANNKALEIMAEMEGALKGNQPFAMTFVSSRCTRVSTNVWQMVKHLSELAPAKYGELFEQFKAIQKKINAFLASRSVPTGGPLAIPISEVGSHLAGQVGSKMANLGEIGNRIHLKVPEGFAITAQAYYRFIKHNDLQTEIHRRMQAASVDQLDELYKLSSDLQQLIIRSEIPKDLEDAIGEQYRRMEGKEKKVVALAMRSSALGEDLSETTSAGQYRSELNVSQAHILEAYKEIVASKYGLPAMTYRLNRGIRDEDVAMCVGCTAMVDAVSGGVMYSRNPVNIRDDAIIINSAWGLPKSVVDGSFIPDLYVISRGEPMKVQGKEIAVKDQKYACYPGEGVSRLEIDDDSRSQASIDDGQALLLAQLAVRLEIYYGVPQDIEWAIDKEGAIIILQCRPLKQVGDHAVTGAGTAREEEERPVILKGGVSASPGAGAGRVFIVKRDMDILQFPEGGVLVAAQSLPRWAMVLSRAHAVVTEQGSIAGHLASVAREFGVPGLFGLNGAMGRLENGQMVTVDADGLAVYEGRIDSLLITPDKPKNVMEGSPVYEALRGASRYIAPLNLLDPDSPSFNPRNCKTFHDITRFCHEKSVHEMFQFGKEHRFPERSSKQLYCDTPMQWWVLNLGDGFKGEVQERYVKLDDIVSIPMLALWEGITAVPWEGPPPVDGKGLISVMFQATTNTALTTGVRSKYANRNYFMISRNFCSLHSRLGFHFSIVEALVSDRARENYVSFQFKGGAADFDRRLKRVQFIAEILERYDFRVDIREDTTIARVEDREMGFMVERLKILGYVTIHTRQLDMIMSNNASVSYYRSKIDKDISEMLSSGGLTRR